MAFTNPSTRTAPYVVTDTNWNELVNNWKYTFVDSPRCSVFITANQTLSTGVSDFVDWDGERYDSGNMHSTSVNPENVILNRAGIWLVTATVEFAAHSSGNDVAQLEAAGILLAGEQKAGVSGVGNNFNFSTIFQTTGTADVLKLNVSQTSGGDLDIVRTSNYNPLMTATWLKDKP